MTEIPICVICKRELGKINISRHHLVPKSEGGKDGEIILIHNICHQKIHSFFTVKELKQELHSIDQLTSHEEMVKFIKWVAKKDPSFYQTNKRSNRK